MPTKFSRRGQELSQRANSTTPGSLGEFGRAAIDDVGNIIEGVKSLPSLAGQLVTNPLETIGNVGESLVHHVEDVFSDPIGTFLREPVSTALDFTGAGGVARGVAVKAGLATTRSARLAKLLGVKKISRGRQAAIDIHRTRHGNIGKAMRDADEAASGMLKKYSDDVREDMTFWAEKTRNPLRGDPEGAGASLVQERLKAAGALDDAEMLAQRRQDMWEAANASGLTQEMGFLENYISHYWVGSPEQIRGAAQKFILGTKHAKKRKVLTYDEGIEAGLRPLTTDAAQLTRLYESNLIRVVENNRMIRDLTKLTMGRVGKKNIKAIMREGAAPGNYVRIEHPAMRQAFRNSKQIENIAAEYGLPKVLEDQLAQAKVGTMVHPEVADVLKSVLDKPFDSNAARRFTHLNAFAKKAALSFSFFHHLALTESAFASLGLKGISLGKGSGFRRGLELLKDKAYTNDAIESGLNLGALSDVQASLVKRSLQGMEARLKDVPIAGQVAKGVRKFNDVWDKGLWDYYHTGLKSYAYHELFQKTLKRSPGIDKKVVGRQVAEFVNDAFGGQSWDLMLKSPKWQQAAHWALLAPDWTISNLRIALRPFDAGAVGQLGRAYWARAALAGFSMSSMLNYVISKHADGEGRFSWDNEPGHEMDIMLPDRDEKGRRQYVKLGKQMREPLRWMYEPLKIFGAKLSPGIQIAVEQLTGSTTTRFPLPFKDNPADLISRAGAVGEKFVPFAFQETNFGFALPKSVGTTGFKVINGLKRALATKDNRMMVEWMRAAAENGYNAKQLLGIAKRELAQERKKK